MKFVTITELRANAPGIINELEKNGDPVIITKRGKPSALIRLVSEDEIKLDSKEESLRHGKK